MRRRVSSLVLATLLLCGACATGARDSAAPSATPAQQLKCRWVGQPPAEVDVTFVSGGRLYATAPAGGARRCLLDSVPDSVSRISWGPRAERVLLAPNLAVLPSGRKIAPFEAGAKADWSAPEGKSVLAVTADGRLLKHRTIEPDPVDVTFLQRHDEATYHPAGRHIISSGVGPDGGYGVFLATNQGKDVKPIALGESARSISSLVATPDGFIVVFVADHGTYRHVHSVDFTSLDLRTLYETEDEVTRVAARATHTISLELGSCDDESRVANVQTDNGNVHQVSVTSAARSIELVGRLPTDELVILARHDGCDEPGTLYVWRAGESTLIARNVDAAAVRAEAPAPPEPPPSSTDPPEA